MGLLKKLVNTNKKQLKLLRARALKIDAYKEQIAALRNWAATRAKNASSESIAEEKKEMPILLTRPELELERSFDLNTTKE